MATRRGTTGNDILTGTGAADVITGLAGNDRLTGGNGNDRLDGGGGVDTLIGGNGNDILIGGLGRDSLRGDAGDDRYVIDNAAEIAKATLDAGIDTVQSSVTYTLGTHQEHLTLTGSKALNGTGNAGSNVLTGNSGNNVLNGGAGADTVRGGNGNDTLVFDADDLLLDGQAGTDTLRLPGAGVNLTALNLATVQNVEVLDLRGTGANGAVLTPTLVAALSSTSDTLQVRAGADDTVFISGGWTAAAQVTPGYDRYTAGAVTLNVESVENVANSEAARVVNGRIGLGTLNGSNGFRLDGAAGDNSGFDVSGAGDVNGDGFADLMIGAYAAQPNGFLSGSSYVVFGGSGAVASIDLAMPDGITGFRLDGVAANDRSGRALSNAGDVNGDGYDDLMIGSWGPDNNGDLAGSSYVVLGTDTGFAASTNLASLDGTDGFRLDGTAEADYAGFAVSAAGDVNGDGLGDLLIGAYGADPNGNGSGATYVVFGSTGGFAATIELGTLNGTDGFRLTGVAADDASGIAVSSAGDINGDGYDDILIGASRADPNGSNAGASYIVFGAAGGFTPNVDLGSLNGSNGFRVEGVATGDSAGYAVSTAGDINGDGCDDLVVGALTADPNGSYSGATYVVFGATGGFAANLNLAALNGANGFRLDGVAAGDRSGRAVNAAGDVNADGYDDLIIGAYLADPSGNSSGASYLIFGAASGFMATFGLATIDGVNGLRLDGVAAGDQSGIAVSGAGDVNGDGFDDVVVGAWGANPGNFFSGSSYVLYGRDFTGGVARPGSSDNDTLTGIAANESLVGGQGNDTLDGGLGGDVLIGGAGDDTLVWDAADRRVDGGGGTDTLKIVSGGADLTGGPDVRGIEVLDLHGGSAGTVVLDRAAVFALTDGRNDLTGTGNTLVIRADSDDLVRLDSTWIATGTQVLDTVTFDAYTSGNATVLVQFDGRVLVGGGVSLFPDALEAFGGVRFAGTAAGDRSGEALANIGDFNGDGLDDFAIGAYARAAGTGAAYIVFGQSGGYPAATDLDTLSGSGGFRIEGAAAPDLAGFTVAPGGDVNGDGYDDLLVVAGGAPASSGKGVTYVVFGTATPPASSFDLGDIDGSNGFALVGETALDYSGISVASGDVNGDGYDDVIVGAHLADHGGTSTGSVYVVYGKGAAFAASTDLDTLGAADGYRIDGAAASDAAGVAVAAADIDGDGYDDVVIGAYQPDPDGGGAGVAGTGMVGVVYGSATGGTPPATLSGLDGATGLQFTGAASGDATGFAISAAGDVNGDGLEDLVIGAYGADPNGATSGAAYVVFGRAGSFATTIALNTLDGNDGYRIDGALAGDRAGVAVGAAGDVNGDGYDDLLVGALGADPGGDDFAGSTWLVFGKADGFTPALSLATLDDGAGLRFDGVAANDFSGRTVSGAGDVDGDGFDDLLIGAYRADGYAGATYLVFGRDYTGAVDQQGGTGNDTLTGGAADECLVGGRGDDTLSGGGGGEDVLLGGAGNDVLVWDALDRRVDGGTGTDTLRIDGSGVAIDLTLVPDARLAGIDVIDLTGSGNNGLVLGLTDLLALTDHASLRIAGNSGDVVLSLGAGWTPDGGPPVLLDGQNYASWSTGAATLLVDTDITQFLS